MLVVDDDAIKFLFTMLRRVSEEINEIAKTAHRTSEAPPSDMEPLFEHICYTWYAAGVIQYELVKQQKEVEERESNEFCVITFHPRRFPLKTKSVSFHAYLSQAEYEYIQQKQLHTLPTVSAYLRQMAVYGYAYDLNKVSPYLPKMVFLVNSIESNFNQILRIIGEEKEEQEKYNFNVAYNIPNIQNKVGDICRILRFMQFELR